MSYTDTAAMDRVRVWIAENNVGHAKCIVVQFYVITYHLRYTLNSSLLSSMLSYHVPAIA